MSLARFFDVMSRDDHSLVSIFSNGHQMLPNAKIIATLAPNPLYKNVTANGSSTK